MSKLKVGFFFGAGAEMGYGMPSGGDFALNIFRSSVSQDKEAFRAQLKKVSATNWYAANWLPHDFATRRLHVFGKGEYEAIIASSLEYRRGDILEYLKNFDQRVEELFNRKGVDKELVIEKYEALTSESFGMKSYTHSIKLNKLLNDETGLFGSKYFSAFLHVLETNPKESKLKKVIRSLLEMLVGVYGQQLASSLNDRLFEEAPDQLTVFDDLAGIFSLNYKNIGQTAMELVLEQLHESITEQPTIGGMFAEIGHAVLEEIFSRALDYQSLIDNHFRYLYTPKVEWAKFSRIAIFLHTVRRYITTIEYDHEKMQAGPGYYHDLLQFSEDLEVTAIGTSNYNHFLKEILSGSILDGVPVYHLNGSVDDFYDPYTNRILSEDELQSDDHIKVPLLFTQSGIKPMTAIKMSQKYVELYEQLKRVNVICVAGFAFNGDDGHINGLIRSLVEEEGKQLIILGYKEKDLYSAKRYYRNKLRLSKDTKLDVFAVDDDRKCKGMLWYELLANQYSEYRRLTVG